MVIAWSKLVDYLATTTNQLTGDHLKVVKPRWLMEIGNQLVKVIMTKLDHVETSCFFPQSYRIN